MRFVVSSALRSIFQNPKETLLILLNMILCTATVFVFVQNYYYLKEHFSDYYDKDRIASNYMVHMNVSNMHSYLDDIKNCTPMYYVGIEVYNEIEKDPDVFFYDFSDNSIDTEDIINSDKIKDLSYYDSESECYYVNAVKYSEKTLRALNLTVNEGRSFTSSDSDNNDPDSPVSVILGSDYKGKYDIGDVIEFDNGSDSDKAEVVGFLKADSYYTYLGDLYSLDDHIITATDFPRDFDREIKQGINNHGFIHTSNPDLDLQKYVNAITAKNGFYTLELEPSDGVEISETKDVSEKNVILIGMLAITGGVICTLALAMILYNRSIRNRAKYCIFMCVGVPVWKINASITFEMMVLLVVSIFPTIALSIYEYGKLMIPVWQIFAFTIPIIVVSLIPTFKVNGKTNIDEFIRNKIV